MKKIITIVVLALQAILLCCLIVSSTQNGVTWLMNETSMMVSAKSSAWGSGATAQINAKINEAYAQLNSDDIKLMVSEKRNDKNCVILQLTVIHPAIDAEQTKEIYELWFIPQDNEIFTALKCVTDIQPEDFYDLTAEILQQYDKA